MYLFTNLDSILIRLINPFEKADKNTCPKMLVLSSGSIQLARKCTNNVQRSKRASTVASQRDTSRREELQKRNTATVSTILSGKFLKSNSHALDVFMTTVNSRIGILYKLN